LPAVDAELLRQLFLDVGEDRPAMDEIIRTFLATAPALVEDAAAASAARDARAFLRAVHTLKTSAGMLGAGELSRLAREAEARAAAGELSGSAATVAALRAELERAMAALRAWSP
jgi:HPt (histidine-containing phosphotransfer) domain-containing protein